jgi:hypothetical protein
MLAISKRYYRIPTTKVQLKDTAKVKFIGVDASCSGKKAMPFQSVWKTHGSTY